MQSKDEEPERTKMEELRLVCEVEIPIQQQKMDSAVISFRSSLESIKSRAQHTLEGQGNLRKLKINMREMEDDLVKVLAVKSRKEAKKMAIMDSVSSTKARIEELKRIVEDQRNKRDEQAAIMSEQYLALVASEEKENQDNQRRREIQDAISWYNRVLHFRIETGHGVKFIFSNINSKNPDEEYSFTIRHENDIYTLLDCYPHLDDTTELIHELNRTNGLFKFVKIMRGKFREAAASAFVPEITCVAQDSSTISVSAPVSSVSTDSRSGSPTKKYEHQIPPGVANSKSKRGRGRGCKTSNSVFIS